MSLFPPNEGSEYPDQRSMLEAIQSHAKKNGYTVTIHCSSTKDGTAYIGCNRGGQYRARYSIKDDIRIQDTAAFFQWGASIDTPTIRRNSSWKVLKWAKLTLEDEKKGKNEEGLPCHFARKVMRELPGGPLEPVDVVKDYLGGLWFHVEKELHRGLMNIKSYEMSDSMEKVVVLTVPASWTIQATRRTYDAGMRAGLGAEYRLHIIKEPEAAAMNILLDMEKKNLLTRGNCFIVCDAGGGTVDLVSYVVEQTHPLRLQQCTEPTGNPPRDLPSAKPSALAKATY
ncbi:MAG: hypothetical protein M1839_004753 [Geoglossum umbratile]|nr:MAG: hypothetical protein M1839_004753 [Geoglossum umbratile]